MRQGKGFALVILSAVLFGLMPLMAKTAYAGGSNPLTLCVHRFFFGMPFLWLLVKFGAKQDMRITVCQAGKLLVLSLFLAVTPALLYSSYNYIPSGLASTIHFIYPVAVIVGCVVFCRERISPVRGICTLLCILGIMGFYVPGEAGSSRGILLALVSGVTYASYIVYFSKCGLGGLHVYKLGFYMSLFCFLELAVMSVCTGQLTFDLTPKAWGISVLFAFMVCVLATVTFQQGTRIIGPQKAAIVSTFEPVTGVLVGFLVFGERMGIKEYLGIACILTAVLVLAVFDRKE